MENQQLIPANLRWLRLPILALCLIAFLLVFIYQRHLLGWLQSAFNPGSHWPFILSRSFRLVANDLICVAVFVAVFNRAAEVKLATAIFLLELTVLLPAYLIVKLQWEGTSEISSPLLSFFHRLIVNPLLMLMLLAGLMVQRFQQNKTLF